MRGRFNFNSGGSASINGLIEEYMVASNGKINAGDFVKYISEVYGERQVLTNNGSINTNYLKVLQISNSQVFILYHKNNCPYGVICTITNTSIKMGTETMLYTKSIMGNSDCVLIGTNKILISYMNINEYCECKLYEINENTLSLTCISDVNIISITKIGHDIELYKFSDNFVVMTHGGISTSSSSSTYTGILYLTTITINTDETLSLGTTTYIDTNNMALYKKTIKLDDNFIALFYSNGSGIIKVKPIHVSEDNQLIMYASTEIRSASKSNIGKCLNPLKLDDTTYLLSYAHYSTRYETYYYILKINKDNVNVHTSEKIFDTSFLPDHLRLLKLKNNNVMVLWVNASTKYLHSSIYSVDMENYAISLENDTVIDTNGDMYNAFSWNTMLLNDENLLVVGANKSNDLFVTYDSDNINRVSVLENAGDKIFGVAKTKGVENNMIKIYVPDVKNNVGGVALLNKLKNLATQNLSKLKDMLSLEVTYAR